MVLGGCKMVLGGFRSFHVLVTTKLLSLRRQTFPLGREQKIAFPFPGLRVADVKIDFKE